MLWTGDKEGVSASSVFKDHSVENLFDNDNQTFWLSNFGSEIMNSSIELGNFTQFMTVIFSF